MIEYSKILDSITPESINDWLATYETKKQKYNETLDEFHKIASSESIENMIKNTNSESAEHLFLYDYAKKYGRECNDGEYEQYSNEFTADIYYIYGYYFHMMIGQGCAIEIIKDLDTFEIELIASTGITVVEDDPDREIIEYLKDNGVTHIKRIPNQGICGLYRFLFTTGLCCNMNTNKNNNDFYTYRYCYKNHDDAVHDIETWDGTICPKGNWIKRKGRNGDISKIELLKKHKLTGRIMASLLPNKEFKFHSFNDGILKIRNRMDNSVIVLDWLNNPIDINTWGFTIDNVFISSHPDDVDGRKPENHPLIQKLMYKI